MKQPSSGAGRHLISGTIRIFLAESLIIPTGFISAVYLARKLGPIDYGLFALASIIILWIEWLNVALFSHTTIKFVGEAKDWKPIGTTIIQLHLISSIVIATLIWFLSSPLAGIFNEPTMANYLKLYAIDIPIFSMARANCNILIGTGCFKERARISISRRIARLLLIIMFVEMGLSVNGAIMGMIGASVVELAISRLYISVPLFSKSSFKISNLLGFATPLFLSALCLNIIRLDLFALKVIGGTAAIVGFYGAARNLSIPLHLFSGSLEQPLLSTLSNLISNRNDREAKEIAKTSMRSILWLMPLIGMSVGASHEIILLIFGEKYLPASTIFSFLIIAALGLITINICRAILTALGKPGWTFLLTGPMVPVALIGYLILIPSLGGVGAAMVTAIVMCLGAAISLYTVFRIWKVLPPYKTIANGAICTIITFAIASIWQTTGFVLILKLLVIVAIILMFFYLLGEFTKNEIHMIRSLVIHKAGSKKSKVTHNGG